MIQIIEGNLFDSNAHIIAHQVNCQGVMGSGVAKQVKERFSSLDYGHLEYVFDCLRKNTTQIRNIRAYMLTSLYNAPVTMSPYYQAAVQHDFGP